MASERDDFDADLDSSADETSSIPFLRRPPRRDAVALGFGLAFIVFGMVGMLSAFGGNLPSAWLYPIILIGLGAAGLVSLVLREQR